MIRVPSVVRVFALAILAASPASAQGHHAAQVGEKLGTVRFTTSCAPRVAPQFDRAVALLHSFEFGASLRAFGEVLGADSTCAMAQWGRALSRWSNPMAAGNRAPAQLAEGRRFADDAARLADRATARERGYIAAVGRLYRDYEHVDQDTRIADYERAMADLVAQQPADTEAKIFHAIALVATAAPSDKSYVKQRQAGALLEALWTKQPDHPCPRLTRGLGGATVCRDRAQRGARPAHAVAHLHATRLLERIGAREPAVLRRGDARFGAR